MEKYVESADRIERIVEVKLAVLQAVDSKWGTTRRGLLGAGHAGPAGFDSESARPSWIDASGFYR